jgi:Xaa-Pro aminopeptidase
MFRLPAALLIAAGLSAAGDPIPKEEFRSRREALRKALPGSAVVLFGRTERETEALHLRFSQEPNFYYLTGWREPGAMLLLSPNEEVLFLPARDPKREVYTGKRAAAEDAEARAITGFDEVLPATAFEGRLQKSLENWTKIHALEGTPAAEKLRAMFPLRDVSDAAGAIGKLRLKKSAGEIELIRRSVNATVEAHRAAWRRIAPGVHEYQVGATLAATWLDLGCERSAYPPIIGSGANATVLHYEANWRRMDSGDVLVIDAGAECAGYAADVTRTVPVNGKFSERQRELYEIVLGAQKAAIAAVKPGATLEKGTPASVNDIAYDYINSHGKDRHGDSLGKYFLHTVGHHVGLDVHDAGSLLKYGPLEAGMVVAIEPGIYIAEEGIGIRIEDMVLVTESGCEVLSASLPREAADIERALEQ